MPEAPLWPTSNKARPTMGPASMPTAQHHTGSPTGKAHPTGGPYAHITTEAADLEVGRELADMRGARQLAQLPTPWSARTAKLHHEEVGKTQGWLP
jgi:hypothetical protein